MNLKADAPAAGPFWCSDGLVDWWMIYRWMIWNDPRTQARLPQYHHFDDMGVRNAGWGILEIPWLPQEAP